MTGGVSNLYFCSFTELIPSHIKVPSGPYSCGCEEHLDKIESEIELPISAKRLYDLLFSSGSSQAIWEAKNNASGGSNLRMGPWETVDGKQQRVLKYILPVNNPMGKPVTLSISELILNVPLSDSKSQGSRGRGNPSAAEKGGLSLLRCANLYKDGATAVCGCIYAFGALLYYLGEQDTMQVSLQYGGQIYQECACQR